jgi:hypothetical protein
MQIAGAAGDLVEVTLVGYEFPHIARDRYDSNWLKVQTSVSLEGRSWTTVDPCLTTIEVEVLADWLDALADDRPADAELLFTEPALEFEVGKANEQNVRLQIWFGPGARPPWRPGFAGDRDFGASFEVAPTELRFAAADLRRQLERYPTRARE